MSSNKNLPKTCPRFFCIYCDYGTSKKSSYDEHVLTSKHEKSIISNKNLLKTCSHLICEKCNKTYKDSSGLWRHKKKCFPENENIKKDKNIENNEHIITPELIINIIQQNQEFKDMLLEQNKTIIELSSKTTCSYGVTHNTVNNNSNNKFNLNFFLNETCKDAMNIKDFVDSIKFQLSDLESIGELGYVKGIYNIIIKNLNELDENMRPVHCVDLKRERIYVKDGGKWEKECPDYKILKNAIKYITQKNVDMIPAFEDKYPDCHWVNSMRFAQYVRLSAIGGEGIDEDRKSNKIISKIAKEILIEKKIW